MSEPSVIAPNTAIVSRAAVGNEGVKMAARQMRNPTRSVDEFHLKGVPVRRACINIPSRDIRTASHAATAASHEARYS